MPFNKLPHEEAWDNGETGMREVPGLEGICMETILRTENLTKQYHRVCAVDRVSLTIEKGDIFGFIGENGAGKTNFMRMVSCHV